MTCLDVMIHYPQDKADGMVKHLASLADKRLIVSFAPKTPYYSVLKRIGELFPGPSKVSEGEGGGAARVACADHACLPCWCLAKSSRTLNLCPCACAGHARVLARGGGRGGVAGAGGLQGGEARDDGHQLLLLAPAGGCAGVRGEGVSEGRGEERGSENVSEVKRTERVWGLFQPSLARSYEQWVRSEAKTFPVPYWIR